MERLAITMLVQSGGIELTVYDHVYIKGDIATRPQPTGPVQVDHPHDWRWTVAGKASASVPHFRDPRRRFLGIQYGHVDRVGYFAGQSDAVTATMFFRDFTYIVPWWLLLLLTPLPAVLILARTRLYRAKARLAKGLCPSCAYNLAGLPTCPECNWQPAKEPTP